jgi:hypothetical protein
MYKKMPAAFETAIRRVLPTTGIKAVRNGSFLSQNSFRERRNNLFDGSHPAFPLSCGTNTRRKPRLLLRLSGLLLLRIATRQFPALLFQLPPRCTRFKPTIIVRRRKSTTFIPFFVFRRFYGRAKNIRRPKRWRGLEPRPLPTE